tara:strand:- start:8325 stop:9824 length:1500 start_codon:yes stop_codon:yes gene_type:complete
MKEVLLFSDVAEDIGFAKYAGVYRIATSLRELGAKVKVIDCFTSFTQDEVLKLIELYVNKNTVFVGIASTLLHRGMNTPLHGFENSFFEDLKNSIKIKNENCKLIIGGSRIGNTTRINGIDFFFIGKADISMQEFYKHLCNLPNNLKVQDINGCKYINTTDHNVSSNYFSQTQNIYTRDDFIEHGECLPLEVARGCIFKCSFCQYDLIGKKKNEYIKDYSKLREELIRNYELFGTTHYLFSDDIINESIDKVKHLHKVFTSLPFKITWTSYARLDLFWKYPEMRELLQEAGATGLFFGIETMDANVGKLIGKGLGKDRIVKTLDYLNETYKDNVIMTGNFIIGLPQDTEENIYSTFNWLSSQDCPLDSFDLVPLNLRRSDDGRPMNDIAMHPEKYGYKELGRFGGHMINWENNYLTFERAMQIHEEFKSSDIFYQKNLVGNSWLGRIINLGYKEEDLKKLIFKKKSAEESHNIMQEWRDVTINKIQDYKNKMLNPTAGE